MAFTSIQERIRVWRKETMTASSAPSEAAAQPMNPAAVGRFFRYQSGPRQCASFTSGLRQSECWNISLPISAATRPP
jgi:hypothetical protein